MQDSITIQITPAFRAAGIYSVYAKVDGAFPKAISPVLTNIIEVTAPPAEAPSKFSAVRVTPMISTVHRGEAFTIFVYYTHEGKADSAPLYAAIGSMGVFGFGELEVSQQVITVPADTEPVERVEAIDIPTRRLRPDSYDIYAKIGVVPDGGAISPFAEDVVQIIK